MGYRNGCFCENRFWPAGVKEMGSKCEVLLDIAFLEFALASAERSFTAMKYLKRYFGNTMTEFRLNGLAFGSEMEVRGSEEGKEVFSVKKFAYEKAGKVCWENRCMTGKPWNESPFVVTTAKL
ncbi:hypothetical protein T07_2686 [Trichinella nelsoni]|uniref:Uncharacterized protein n=1 Tax=Trichinella nelsoni TaxID=6336 RepID=A0A0V0RHP0_9BILA|nr:hypothetical protein T07_12501 [Trichinella nelsoni]KRX14308.1 hypothetical protein T07_2686 [Trichinella nelsoni]